MAHKKKKPKFNVLNLGFFRSVKPRWRKPRGTHNKKRMRFAWAGASPRIGYRNAWEARGVHPSGLREALVHNVPQLQDLKGVVLRIASGVGARKRKAIEEKAKAMGLRVLNAASGVQGQEKKYAARPRPAHGSPQPAAGSPQPAARSRQPATGSKGPRPLETGSQKPKAGNREPAARPAAPKAAPAQRK